MKRMRLNHLAVVVGAIAWPVLAQDMSPSFDASTFARGRATIEGATANARGGWRRKAGSGATERQRAACAGLPRFRAQHGSDHPDVLSLSRKCRQSGLSK
jgi:hypothetical protein